MKQIVIFPFNQLDQATRDRLEAHDIIAVEVLDPQAVRVVSAEPAAVGSDGLLYAAIKAIREDRYTNNTSDAFIKHLAPLIVKPKTKQENEA